MQKIYKKGSRKEYQIISDLKKEGFDIVQRSRGSHSSIDIFAIDKNRRIILFVQSKRTLDESMDYINPKLKEKLEKEFSWLNGVFGVCFEVR